MSILNTSRYLLAVARNEHENYLTWGSSRVTKPKELHDGFYTAYCTMPDGRIGQACVKAHSVQNARSQIVEHVAKSRVAFEYGVNNDAIENQWIAFYTAEQDLAA